MHDRKGDEEFARKLIDEVKEYCRLDLKDNPAAQLAYIEQCINQKYGNHVKRALLDSYETSAFFSEALSGKNRTGAEMIKKYDKKVADADALLESEISATGSLFHFCTKMPDIFLGEHEGPWHRIVSSLLDYLSRRRLNGLIFARNSDSHIHWTFQEQIIPDSLLGRRGSYRISVAAIRTCSEEMTGHFSLAAERRAPLAKDPALRRSPPEL